MPTLNDPYFARLKMFLDVSASETDRGRTLIAASLIEEMLEEILRSFLSKSTETKKLFEPNGALSTLHSKSLLCRSLSLISAVEYADIELVRKIRNEFAHSLMCSFELSKIRDLASNFQHVGIVPFHGAEPPPVVDPRVRFSMVSTTLVLRFYDRAHEVRDRGQHIETVD